MSILIIPCYIKTKRDIDCLNRLFQSAQKQSKPFDKVFVIDDASPLAYELNYDFIDHIKLTENGGPARVRNIGIDKAIALNADHLLFTDHDCILDKE